MNIILGILSDYRYVHDDLFEHLLTFLNSLLKNRNRNTQRTIHHFFIAYRKSEVFFEKLDSVLWREIGAL